MSQTLIRVAVPVEVRAAACGRAAFVASRAAGPRGCYRAAACAAVAASAGCRAATAKCATTAMVVPRERQGAAAAAGTRRGPQRRATSWVVVAAAVGRPGTRQAVVDTAVDQVVWAARAHPAVAAVVAVVDRSSRAAVSLSGSLVGAAACYLCWC